MKELSIEEKAQRYNEALKRAKKLYEQGTITESLSYVFLELKESEDERIRRDIIRYLKKTSPAIGENIKKMLAWLEKQGEFYTKRDVDNAYIEGMAFAKDELEKQNKQILANSAKTCKDEQKPTDEEMKTLLRTEYEKGRADAITEMQKPVDCTDCTNSKGCINCEDGNMKETLVQKTAWSEEDDKKLEWLCRIIHSCKVRKGISLAEESEIGSWVDKWLNYAPQSQWKPSDEQIKAIRLARSFVTDDFGEHNTLSEILIELEAQLKELK